MNRRTPEPSFVIRFVSKDIRPWLVPLRTLTRTLSAVQQIVSEDSESDQREGSVLHLLDVKPGSASYPVFADDEDRALRSLSVTGQIIEQPQRAEKATYVISPLEELSAVAKSLGCEVELALPGKHGEVLARIVPTTYESVSRAVFIYGDTSIEGYVERVGGATDLHCGLRVRGQSRMLICRVEGTEVARQLGQHLYEYVIVSGTATWYRNSWRLRSFSVKSMHQLDDRSLSERFEALRGATPDHWNRIDDPERFIAEIRGED